MASLVAAVLTVLAAQLLDLATFAEMMRRVGPAAEANPIVGLLYTTYGLPTVAIAKLALVALVTAVVVVTARSATGRLTGIVAAAAIVAGLLGGLSNTIAIGVL